MRKAIPGICFFLFLACPAFSQVIGQTNQDLLKGPVKSVRVEKSKIAEKDGKSIEGPRVLSAEYIFDSKARLVESLICDHQGSPYAKYQAIYNDSGKAEETYNSPKGDLIDKMAYSYGPDGRLIEKSVEKARNSPKGKAVLSYDEKGRIIENVHKNTSDRGGFRHVYSYDDAQSKIEATAYDLKGKVTGRAIYRYDKQWRLVEQKFDLNIENSGLSTCIFAYDANGNVAEKTVYLLDAVSKWRYEYQTDSHNNWTRRTTISAVNKDGTVRWGPVEVTYRTIIYQSSSNEPPAAHTVDLASIVATRETASFLRGDAIRQQRPEYPAYARAQLQSGRIIVHIVVDENGRVIAARPAPSKAELLRDPATSAAWSWVFNPSVSGGVAVTVCGPLTFNFTL